VVGGDEAEVGVAAGLDAAGDAGGDEPLRVGDGHGRRPTSGRPSVSGRPKARFMHCRAWPLVPFTRLSIAAMTTTQPVRSSRRAVTWQVLAPIVAFVDGGSSVTTTNGS